ncbi:MAG: hypothetical protein IPQ02_03925 [Saprospiraceae bacterium]|uniref:Uncharacterized protein n=1 Tax=Candidatus Defluviibacterium haderslevense TaxID=2981993 RepID=A0A9D7SBY0_9BACT|nr:hypothetical protein [Candidatus Defluviibacterium haderslevense]MBL0235770.1 hypothetical protein [Candidatus Defluviibacterium haderslevense]
MRFDQSLLAMSCGSIVGICTSFDLDDMLKTIIMSTLSAIASYLATTWIKRMTKKKDQ